MFVILGFKQTFGWTEGESVVLTQNQNTGQMLEMDAATEPILTQLQPQVGGVTIDCTRVKVKLLQRIFIQFKVQSKLPNNYSGKRKKVPEYQIIAYDLIFM